MTTGGLRRRGYWQQRADVVVIGTGVAGLAAALAAHRRGRKVVVLSKASETATFYAQGGIAVVLPRHRRLDRGARRRHAGRGCRAVRSGRGALDRGRRLRARSPNWSTTERVSTKPAPGQWALTREGGHSRRRIIHAGGDATGAEVQRALDHAAATLDIRRNHVALEVLQDDGAVTGVLVLNDDGLGVVHAPSVILATGGLGHLYTATTNPEGSTGDGVALAMWAGPAGQRPRVHPVPPDHAVRRSCRRPAPADHRGVRGEGAILVDRAGNSVTAGVHPMGDLAPRDVVAAAIDARLAADRRSVCVPRRTRHRRLRAAVPDRDGGVPGRGHRSDAPTDSGGAGRALQLRRRRHRRVRAHRAAGPVRGGRGGPHRHARREPAGVQQPARGPGRRRPGREGGRRARRRCRAEPCDAA